MSNTIRDQFGDKVVVDIEVSEEYDGVYLFAGEVRDYIFTVEQARELARSLIQAAAALQWQDDVE